MTTTYFSLATGNLFQDWSNTGLITTDDSWAGVPSITGYRGDALTSATGVNAGTVTGTSAVVDVNANRSDPNTFTTGGIAEFDGIANPVVALQGSGTARAPYLDIYLDATGRENVTLSFNARDIDGSGDNAAQQIAVQYRTSPTGAWINLPAAYIADASTGPSLATLVTPVSVTLPADANNAAQLEVRIITTDAVGSDEWIGIDDISVTSQPLVVVSHGTLSIGDSSVVEGDSGSAALTFTVDRNGGSDGAVSATWTVGFATANAGDLAAGQLLTGTVNFADGQTSATITLQVAGDTEYEPNASLTVTLSAPTGGAALGDASAVGTITNDDPLPPLPPVGETFINEIHYDNSGTDSGEAIEVAAPAGTDLAGWTIVLYNGGTDGVNRDAATTYATINLSGIVPDQDDGYGTLSFNPTSTGIQNGPFDGMALVRPDGTVAQFISYEGVITAANGPAAGLTSTDIGVSEGSDTDAFSMQLTGTGAVYGDFHWTGSAPDNFGAVNGSQDFIGRTATGLVSAEDAAIVEGNSGTQMLVFTVHRAGGLGQSASVDWNLNLAGSADTADLGAGQPLSGHIDFAAGVFSVQVQVAIAGDTLGERNETFSLQLSNPAGNISITDGTGVGTILNDDPIELAVYEIQGAAHRSPVEGQPVITHGIVTAVTGLGFYLQDPTGDGNSATSDGIFVFTGHGGSASVGDGVEVRGNVNEFQPGEFGLTVTEIEAFGPGAITVQSTGNTLPTLLIGPDGVLPPTSIIDDDGLVYDPQNDGIDFYESIEGMHVTVQAPLVVGNTDDRFGETWIVAGGGDGATGINERGGITISDGDLNPERILLDEGASFAVHTQGDRLADVTGVISYQFDHYRLLPTENVVVTEDVTVSREDSSLAGDRDHLTVASYNVQNLGPDDVDPNGVDKFDLLGHDIAYSLNAPDIIALQEIQDADGAGSGSNLSGAVTAQLLIDAIEAAGGPHYIYVEIPPPAANVWGGEPNGNIRSGFLFNPDRVSLVEDSLSLIQAPAFSGNVRRPLVATFDFNGQHVTLIDVHLTARLGGDPTWGANQPAPDAGDGARTAQAEAVRAYVDGLIATDPSLKLGVLGDFNGFWFEDAVGALEAGGVMTDLQHLLDVNERYSATFEGNLQGIDHIVVTGGLYDGAAFDAVHRNAEQLFGVARGSDHDPILARFYIEHPNEAPFDIELDGNAVDENAPAGTLVGTVTSDDPDPEDVPAYSLIDDAGGRFAIDEGTGAITTTAPLDHEEQASWDVVVRVTDPHGLSTDQTFTIDVNDLNEAPVAATDAVVVDEDATTDNLWSQLLGNDNDPDDGDSVAIVSVDSSGTLGSVVFDEATQTLLYVADNDAFDQLAPGTTQVDHFTYTIADSDGLTSTATVDVTVTGIDDGVADSGGNGADRMEGGDGEDELSGGNGADVLLGLAGHDVLLGGSGDDVLIGGLGRDRLEGGRGNDTLFGGQGADLFVIGKTGGADIVVDYQTGQDQILLEDGLAVRSARVEDANNDGIQDLVLAFTGGGSVTLLGVSDVTGVSFAGPADLNNYPPF